MKQKKFLSAYFSKKNLVYPVIFVFFLLLYYLTSAGHTPYDYFTRLADAFIKGQYFLTDNPPWLNELIPVGNQTFYVVYPPMPAILAIPFRFIFKARFYQEYLSFLVGAGVAAATFRLARKISKKVSVATWITLLTSMGSVVWFLSATGSSWYLGQLTAMFFVTLALGELFTKKRPFIVGIFLGAAIISRVNLVVIYPFFLVFLFDKNWKRNFLKLALGSAPFIVFNFYYNFLRFGTIFDRAYYLIPGVLAEPWYEKGILNLSYIPRHLKVIFWELPKWQNTFPFVKPSWAGLAIWITTPAFVYALWAPIKKGVVKASWITILMVCLIIFSHGTTGFAQFGYRFAVDFYPFLILLTTVSVTKTGLKWHHWLLLALGITVNLWGVLWINKFGWVGF
jgi:hypothetical protein